MTMDDVKTFAEFTREFVNAARDARKAGRSVDDFANSWKVPAKFTGYAPAQAAAAKNAAEVVYGEVK
jgi:hypothetical protein